MKNVILPFNRHWPTLSPFLISTHETNVERIHLPRTKDYSFVTFAVYQKLASKKRKRKKKSENQQTDQKKVILSVNVFIFDGHFLAVTSDSSRAQPNVKFGICREHVTAGVIRF